MLKKNKPNGAKHPTLQFLNIKQKTMKNAEIVNNIRNMDYYKSREFYKIICGQSNAQIFKLRSVGGKWVIIEQYNYGLKGIVKVEKEKVIDYLKKTKQ